MYVITRDCNEVLHNQLYVRAFAHKPEVDDICWAIREVAEGCPIYPGFTLEDAIKLYEKGFCITHGGTYSLDEVR